jgi:hypothetical protein
MTSDDHPFRPAPPEKVFLVWDSEQDLWITYDDKEDMSCCDGSPVAIYMLSATGTVSVDISINQ